MENTKLEKLRIACNKFYMDKYMDQPVINDEEFDALRKEFESETGNSIFSLVEWEGKKIKNEIPIGLVKEIVGSNNLEEYVTNYLTNQCIKAGYNPNDVTPDPFNICDYVNYYLNYKYDGCSIIGIYDNGRLKEVRSTPDEAYGILRTKAFCNIFPNEIDDCDVVALQGEALVDYRAYGQLARNKANGLVNSIYKDEEVANEIFVRIYKVYYNADVEAELNDDPYIAAENHFYRQLQTLNGLPEITRTRTRLGSDGQLHEFKDIVFSRAERFIASQCPKDALITPHGWDLSAYFQVDGVVLYSDRETKAFKFYYTESAITTITNVEWNLQANGGWAPKLQFDTIKLNDKNISQAASGGVPNLLSNKMGIGAKVRVILANMTIPKIIEVLEPSENYNWPVCECGYQISEKDIFGSGVKCQSLYCDRRAKQWYDVMVQFYNQQVGGEFVTCTDSFKEHTFDYLARALQIDRWNAEKSAKFSMSKIASDVLESLNNIDVFYCAITNNFNFSDLQLANLKANYGASYEALHRFLS